MALRAGWIFVLLLILWGCRRTDKNAASMDRGSLTRNFHESEFSCPHCGKVTIDPNLVLALQQLRDAIDQPIRITSGYRCPIYNQRVGGVCNSLHLEGKAADVTVPGMSTSALVHAAGAVPAFRDGGIGAYPRRSFVHLDIRNRRARWGFTRKPNPKMANATRRIQP